MALRRTKKKKNPIDEGGYEVDLDAEVSDDVLDPPPSPAAATMTEGQYPGLPVGKSFIIVGPYAIVHIDRRNLELYLRSKINDLTKYRPIGYYGTLDGILRMIVSSKMTRAIPTQDRKSIGDFLEFLKGQLTQVTAAFGRINPGNFDNILGTKAIPKTK